MFFARNKFLRTNCYFSNKRGAETRNGTESRSALYWTILKKYLEEIWYGIKKHKTVLKRQKYIINEELQFFSLNKKDEGTMVRMYHGDFD